METASHQAARQFFLSEQDYFDIMMKTFSGFYIAIVPKASE